jgi:hypothetical protein
MSALSYLEIDTSLQASVSESLLPILPDSATLNTDPRRVVGEVPAAIPASQAYYWTGIWQAGERTALAELARGQGRYFTNPRDALGWLLSPED